MKHLVSDGRKRTAVPAAVLLVIITNLALILEVLHASSLAALPGLQANTPYPTYPTFYPPAWQTQESAVRQTQQAAVLTPSLTGTFFSFPAITSTPFPTEIPVHGTPAGDGEISNYGGPAFSKMIRLNIQNMWSMQVGSKEIQVIAGSDYNDDLQGMVDVGIFIETETEYYELPDSGRYLTPDRSGAVRVVGAQGQRLILVSTQGETYYFDVPGRQFTTSLTANIPMATPVPITPTPSPTPTVNGDTAHSPRTVPGLSPVNTPLHFIISGASEAQWFRFRLDTPGSIQVHLTDLPADYDLYVYSASYHPNYGGQSTNSGTTSELVVIDAAPVDDYYARVVSVNGAFDPIHPYQLEFDVLESARN